MTFTIGQIWALAYVLTAPYISLMVIIGSKHVNKNNQVLWVLLGGPLLWGLMGLSLFIPTNKKGNQNE